MNGNKFLYKYEQMNLYHGINQMIDDFHSGKVKFPSGISNEKLVNHSDAFKIMVGILAYIASKEHYDVPSWVANKKLSFEHPYYLSNRLTPQDKVRLVVTSPSILVYKKIFLDVQGLSRM